MTCELYTQIVAHNQALQPCPLCGSPSELWQFSRDDLTASKVVMCSNGDPVAEIESGCPMFMPPEDFYCATQREAASRWNTFCAATEEMRSVNKARK